MEATLNSTWNQQYSAELLPQRDEPEWHTQLRRQAWEIWLDMPEPPPAQRNLRKIPPLDLASLTPALPVSELDTALKALSLGWGELSGLYLEQNGSALDAELTEALSAQGVIFCSLSDALAHHPDLVKAHLGSVLPATGGKEAALNLAYWRGGYFLYLPRNVQLELPLYALQSLQGEGQVVFSRSLVVAESGARATLIQDSWSENGVAAGSRISDLVELVIGDNAEVNLLQPQQWGRSVHALNQTRARLSRDARFTPLLVASGSAYHLSQTAVDLTRPGAQTLLLGLFVGDGEQHLRQNSLQNHLSPHTESDLQYHAVLRDRAYSFYNGMIYVDGTAQQTTSNQVSKSMLLSDEARADAIPNLEILADDVQSGHGAAIGSLDREQLFYLQSRGFDQATAEALLVEGFMESVILRFPHEALHAAVKQHLAMRLLEREDD
ncbi:MAG: Fe-S cluster assembly protein SufD [Candidatus Sericytochromatia bacterium]